jgi:Spy/CpxP family protein refolding chaperone
MKPKVLSIILIFSLALNLAVIGTFIFRKIEPPPGPDERFSFDRERPPFFQNMQLDDEQRDAIMKLMHEFRQINRENRQKIFALEDELMQTLHQDDYDSSKTDSLIDKIGQLRMAQSKQAIKHFRKFNKFLSPEQQEHFRRMIMERPARREGRFRHWRESHGGSGMRGRYSPDSTFQNDGRQNEKQ